MVGVATGGTIASAARQEETTRAESKPRKRTLMGAAMLWFGFGINFGETFLETDLGLGDRFGSWRKDSTCGNGLLCCFFCD